MPYHRIPSPPFTVRPSSQRHWEYESDDEVELHGGPLPHSVDGSSLLHARSGSAVLSAPRQTSPARPRAHSHQCDRKSPSSRYQPYPRGNVGKRLPSSTPVDNTVNNTPSGPLSTTNSSEDDEQSVHDVPRPSSESAREPVGNTQQSRGPGVSAYSAAQACARGQKPKLSAKEMKDLRADASRKHRQHLNAAVNAIRVVLPQRRASREMIKTLEQGGKYIMELQREIKELQHEISRLRASQA